MARYGEDGDLTIDGLRRHPVWVFSEDRESCRPVLGATSIVDDDRPLFIAAKITTSSEHRFDGYLVGAETFYAFGLFVGDEDLTFNATLPERIDETLTNLRKLPGLSSLELFPLRYESPVRGEDGLPLVGVLDFRNDAERNTS